MHLCPSGTSPLKEFSSPWTEIDSPSHRARHLISRDRLGFRVSVHLSLHLICFKCIFFIFFAEKFPSLASLSWGMVNIKRLQQIPTPLCFQLAFAAEWGEGRLGAGRRRLINGGTPAKSASGTLALCAPLSSLQGSRASTSPIYLGAREAAGLGTSRVVCSHNRNNS